MSSSAPLPLQAALVDGTARKEAADDRDVAAVAGPALPPLPPRARVAPRLRVAPVMIVAAVADDRAIQPVEVIATGLVGVDGRHEELRQPAWLRRAALLRDAATLRRQ